MTNELQDKAIFLSFCIEQYAKAKNRPAVEVEDLLGRYGISEHFCQFYDVLHTQGHHWLIEEIDEMIENRKLSTESTKYWHLGPVDLYTELQAELQAAPTENKAGE